MDGARSVRMSYMMEKPVGNHWVTGAAQARLGPGEPSRAAEPQASLSTWREREGIHEVHHFMQALHVQVS